MRVPSVCDFYDQHRLHGIIHLVDDPVVTHAHSQIARSAHDRPSTTRPRIDRKRFNCLFDTLPDRRQEPIKGPAG